MPRPPAPRRLPLFSCQALLGGAAATTAALLLAPRGLFVAPGRASQRPEAAPSQLQSNLQQQQFLAEPSPAHFAERPALAAAAAVAAAALGGAVFTAASAARSRRPAPVAGQAGRARLVPRRDSPQPVSAPSADPLPAVVAPRDRTDAVHLTGNTLAAALKMRCDMTGADYAIYWVNVNGTLVVSSDYVTPERRAALVAAGKSESFAEESEKVTFPAMGTTHVSAVYNLGQPMFIADAASDPPTDFKRKELAAEYGVKSICFVPAEAGVLEFGTTKSWSWIPECPVMPKREMRNAFENLGAGYVMFWAEKDGQFEVAGSYCSAERRKFLQNRRGDDKTFCSESSKYTLDATDDGPVAAVARFGQSLFVPAEEATTLKRADLAKEFGIKGMHLIPVKGGVLECGIPEGARLEGNTLQAAMKMRCDNSGAGYALYWTDVDGEFVVAGDYVTKQMQRALEEKGVDGSFAEASKQVNLSASGSGPVAMTARFKEPVFVQDASACENLVRKDFVAKYDIASLCFVPVEGGVLEFGTSNGPETATWDKMPACPDMPKDEMKKAFNEFEADYAIFWFWLGDEFVFGADYVTPEHTRALKNQRGDETSYADISKVFTLPADETNYAWVALQSGKEVVVSNPADDATLQRRVFAEEFKISEVRFVPLEGGVLEYGKSSY